MTDERNNQALVVGLGKTGLSCVRYLHAKGCQLRVVDSRENPPGLAEFKRDYPQIEFHGGDFNEADFISASEIILSPGVTINTPEIQAAIKQGVPCYGDVEIFARYATAPIVAVTGSNGKSTLVTLLAKMIEASGKRVGLGGNIGIPVLELLSETEKNVVDYYVLELSSFQLETTTSLNAFVSIILNVSADHMDRYSSLQDYAHAKQRIYSGDGKLVINLDDEFAQTLLPPTLESHRKVLCYSVMHEADYSLCDNDNDEHKSLCIHDEPVMPLTELKMPGLHNVSNALAALAIGEMLELEPIAMVSELQKFTGLMHRMQFVAEYNSHRWYNDSKGTNVGATCAAVKGLQGKSVLIAGGEAKEADFSTLVNILPDHVRAVVLIGRDADVIESAIDGQVTVVKATDMHDAVKQAAALVQEDDNVLLSPACASFDMFKGFEDRGNCYMQAVNEFIEVNGKS
ncbi:UDP-N-acetylmuramoylalanine--D-glutamate ligase [hydrothermal vent metagenome]|uniref:UDP-N-acetylmuramoylalanine--D-glutamate ligase n=1 Tax=hydrothermal vent metagenome TaxID=652676 RepID=A0A3B0Y7G1_9ZZZZ